MTSFENSCCSHRNIDWELQPELVDSDVLTLEGKCVACGEVNTATLLRDGQNAGSDALESLGWSARDGEIQIAGNCLSVCSSLVPRIHEQGLPATVREIRFGPRAKKHYVVEVNGEYSSSLADCRYFVDPTIRQFDTVDADVLVCRKSEYPG